MRPLKTSPPPPPAPAPATAPSWLARAHILINTHTNMQPEKRYNAATTAASAVLLYGIQTWQTALRRSRLDIIDEEEGMVLLDLDIDGDVDGGEDGGRGIIHELEVSYLHSPDQEPAFGSGRDLEKADKEVKALVKRALNEIKAWDKEVGKRVEFVVREVT